MIQLKTLNKRIATKSQGVFYKEVIDEDEKVVDKVYLIRWVDEDGREKSKTVSKYSRGIRIGYCVEIRNKTMSAISLGADTPHLTKVKSQLTLNAKDIDRLRSKYEIHFLGSFNTTYFNSAGDMHSLRHTFASHPAINGASIITIKNLMHHANIEITLRYSHLMPDSGKNEVMGLFRKNKDR